MLLFYFPPLTTILQILHSLVITILIKFACVSLGLILTEFNWTVAVKLSI
jgi:hypothetical protein